MEININDNLMLGSENIEKQLRGDDAPAVHNQEADKRAIVGSKENAWNEE